MHLQMTSRLLAAAFLSLVAGCQGEPTQSPEGSQSATLSATADCVQRFDGITTCAKGNASLATSEKGVQVTGLKDAKTDGVSSTFNAGITWSQEAQIRVGSQNGSITLAARDGDQVVSTLRITSSADRQVSVTPGFTGSSEGNYRMNVYRDGRLVSTTQQPASFSITFYDWWSFVNWWNSHWHFFSYRSYLHGGDRGLDGACGWRLGSPNTTFSVRGADGKTVVGDTAEFIEEIGDGAYPYRHFSGIDVNASATDFLVTGESFGQEK
ncbi:putative lipoprotein [Corallococcus coralloides]|uniref:Putative lipoprotein n=2 Tax=Corallococcus coralloides TaxID=184914 RepID=A0A410RQ48_CORCK|nr:putative lipoprotein [Corallococcus coralloides]